MRMCYKKHGLCGNWKTIDSVLYNSKYILFVLRVNYALRHYSLKSGCNLRSGFVRCFYTFLK